MFIKSKHTYGPGEILTTRISPAATFMRLVNEVKKRYKNQLKVIYAYLIPNVDDFHQFILVCRQTQTDDKGKPVELYAFFPTVRFSPTCLESYSLYERDGKLDAYFEEFFREPITLDSPKFRAFVQYQCRLSLDRDNAKYWKAPANADALMKKVAELAKINGNMIEARKR